MCVHCLLESFSVKGSNLVAGVDFIYCGQAVLAIRPLRVNYAYVSPLAGEQSCVFQ